MAGDMTGYVGVTLVAHSRPGKAPACASGLLGTVSEVPLS